jgi:diguanylate cyclase (GGDEF)-like protein
MKIFFEEMAKTDIVTGIYNRRYLEENLTHVIALLSRSGGHLSLMMIDVDLFKKYNDTYGHANGDKCLRDIAQILKQSLPRKDDFIVRHGGEEFVVVLPNTDEKGVRIMSEKMLSMIRECRITHEKNDADKYITISIGAITGKVDFSKTGDEYINRAKEMLNKSIQDGYNRYTSGSL